MRIALAALVVLEMALWVSLIGVAGLFRDGPNGRTLSVDFAVFLAGATVLRGGGNPYDGAQLYASERRMLNAQHLPAPKDPRLVRLGNPPILYWVLQPLTSRPYRSVALSWIALMYALAALGLAMLLFRAGRNTLVVGLVASLLMPPLVLAAAYGNLTCLIFAAVAGARALIARVPIAAGLLLSVAWLKPQLGLPAALIVTIIEAQRLFPVAAGFLIGTLSMFAATIAAVGWSGIVGWIGGLRAFGASISIQPNLASLSGLYVSWAPTELTSVLEAVALIVALVATWAVWRTKADGTAAPVWLWLVWFLATPYAHFPDELLLAVPIAALFVGDRWRQRRLPVTTLYVLFSSLVLLPSIAGISLLPVPLIALAVIYYTQWHGARINSGIRSPVSAS